jgi:hypothetical protein
MQNDDELLKVFSIATGRPVDASRVAPSKKRAPPPPAKPFLAPLDEGEPLSALQLRAGLSDSEAAQLCGVTVKTWRRWCEGQARVPRSVRRLLTHYAGEIPSTDRAWRGFVFRGGQLIAPNGEAVTASEIEHRRMGQQYLDHLEVTVKQLEFWRTRSGRAEQVRLARAFGALDAIAVLLVNLHQVITHTESPAVKCEAGALWQAINQVFVAEGRLSKAAGLEESN